MLNRKRTREKGKDRLSHIFSQYKLGDKIVLTRSLSTKSYAFPLKYNGLVAEVVGKSGRAYIVEFLNGKTHKRLTVNSVNLKRLKGWGEND